MFYVSDFLENLLQARTIRDIVSDAVVRRCQTPYPLALILVPLSRKCMGYPAIWLVSSALSIDDSRVTAALQCNMSSLLVSLSTSLADDLIDSDVFADASHLSVLYVLLLKSVGSSAKSEEALSVCLEVAAYITRMLTEDEVRSFFSSGNLQVQDTLTGAADRIGLFHEMIARDFSSALGLEATECAELSHLSRLFGRWCCHLDDFIDIEHDVERGSYVTRPIWRLCAYTGPEALLAQALTEEVAGVINSQRFIAEAVEDIVVDLREIMRICGTARPELYGKLKSILKILPEALFLARNKAHVEYRRRLGS